MKKHIFYCIVLLSILFLIRCEKDKNTDLIKTVFYNNKIPQLTTIPISSITDSTAVTGGLILSDGCAKIISNGVCWNTSPNPSINNSNTSDSIGKSSFSSKIKGLKAFTKYYIRAYATNSVGIAYGNELSFFTSDTLPSIITTVITSIDSNSAKSGGNIINDGCDSIILRGVCWNTSSHPTLTNNYTTNGRGTGSFASNITNLLPNTTYYVRAYATNSLGTSYGNELSFTTTVILPKLTTIPISAITSISASSGGIITSDGGASITVRGVCWSTSINPTVSNTHTSDGTSIGSFTSSITGLTPGTTYHVRAYATNSIGTTYGNQINFTAIATLPILTTTATSSITFTTSTSGGNII